MGHIGQTQLVHAGNIHRGDGSWCHQGPYCGHQAEKSWNQVLKLFRGDQEDFHIKAWDSANLRKATFAVWIHTDSPINSALSDRLLCLPQHTMVPTSRGRQPWASKDTSSSIARLSGHRPLSHQPQELRRSTAHWIWGSEGAREVRESEGACRAWMKQHNPSGSSDKRWHCLCSELDIFRCHQCKYT